MVLAAEGTLRRLVTLVIPWNGACRTDWFVPIVIVKHTQVSPHVIRLLMHSDNKLVELARCHLQTGTSGELLSSFRYLRLKQPVYLKQGQTYILLMSTQVADGDHFRDPVSFDGLSPQLDPDLVVQRGLLLREGTLSGHIELPAFEDLSSDYSQYRLPVGPNLRFAEDGWSDKHDSPKP